MKDALEGQVDEHQHAVLLAGGGQRGRLLVVQMHPNALREIHKVILPHQRDNVDKEEVLVGRRQRLVQLHGLRVVEAPLREDELLQQAQGVPNV